MTSAAATAGGEGWTHHEAVVNNVRLHWVQAGEGPLVILLHGFPQFWWAWRWQIPALAAAGYRVVAPDLRGYNLSEKPARVAAYRIEQLMADVVGLVRHLGVDKAHVVGHDWGGVIAWWMGMLAPAQVDRLVILNAPHPRAFARELMTPDQMLRSWYAAAFQLPILPEAAFRRGDFALLERIFRGEAVRPGAFSDQDIQLYREAAARPGAIKAMLDYYRAAARHSSPRSRRIALPTLVIWGDRDPALSVRLTHGLQKWVPDIRVEHLPEASHWVMEEFPDRVNELLLGFLREGASSHA
ncbi:MAG TPA: alpha/beta hydrolase [Longimicrobium sp.]|jgi:pimeloyl-ACP methyl ester carboxylesterase|uniref:alpha/beta fold hydrolase n=1 Tax=Longimicrobium sp. TaxID=2029185 RepID=UPI002EDB55D5